MGQEMATGLYTSESSIHDPTSRRLADQLLYFMQLS